MKNKMKKLFGTPLRATLSTISLLIIIAILGTGTVYAAGNIAQNSSIGEEKAKNFAFVDAGVDPATVTEVQTEFDYEQGQFVYEVEFSANGTEYDYWINASNGSVVKKEIEAAELNDTTSPAATSITLKEAKRIALNDAKLSEDAVTFTTAELETEHNLSLYEIDFYAQNVEYEYEINAADGTIYSKSKEALVDNQKETSSLTDKKPVTSDIKENTQNITHNSSNNSSDKTETTNNEKAPVKKITLEKAKSIALADAGVAASRVTFTEAKLDSDDGVAVYDIDFYTQTHEYEYEINAATGAVHDKSIEALKKDDQEESNSSNNTGNSGGSKNYIGIDKAKSIAVKHAGLSMSGVTFSKAKLDKDDGITVYDIEFLKDGIEYEYEVDASTGKILDYSKEQAD